jgi:hypothetical protein
MQNPNSFAERLIEFSSLLLNTDCWLSKSLIKRNDSSLSMKNDLALDW